ncbi:MAG: Stp1/IreP family PP2C-type Ser/Thr phosphatase [Bdellovibrionota bacterium]
MAAAHLVIGKRFATLSTTEGQLINTAKLKSVKLRAASLTDVGRRRSENQDSYGYLHTERASLFVVADGMGGARGGGTASAMAVNLIVDSALDDAGELTQRSLQRAIRLSNRVIFSRSQQDSQLTGMGTTVVALAFVDNTAIVAHVGDSRIYLLRDGQITQLTRDHTLVQELVDTGAIPQQDAATHPIAHMLTRSLGPTEAIGVEIHTLPKLVQPGDKFLLCSDGLYNHVSSDQIADALRTKDPQAAVSDLVQQALDGGGSDNVTIEIIEVCGLHDDRFPSDGAGMLPERFVSSEIDVSEFNGMTLQEFVASLGGIEDLDIDDVDESEHASASEQKEEPRPAVSQPSLTAAARPAPRELRDESDFREREVEERDERDSLYGDSGSHDGVLEAPAPKRLQFVFGMLFAGLLCAGVFFIFNRVTPKDLPPQEAPRRQTEKIPPRTESENPSSQQMTDDMMAFDPMSGREQPQPSAVASSSESSESPADANPASSPEAVATTQVVSPDSIGLENPLEAPTKISPPPVYDPSTEDFSKEQTDSMKKYAEVIAMASDIAVPPTPRVSLGGDKSSPADQPIVWENESKLVARVVGSADGQPSPTPESTPAPKLRTIEESRDLASQKDQVRDKISDLDMKLAMLVFGTKEEAKNKLTRLDMEINRSGEAMVALQKDLRDALARDASWGVLQKRALEVDALKLADEVAGVSEEVKEKRAEYRDATENYLSSVDHWQSNPKDAQSASSMGALGREIKEKRAVLELAVSKAVARGAALARYQVQRLRFDLSNLDQKRAQLSRQSGLLRSFVPTTIQRRQEMQRKYLEERSILIKNLNDLRASFPDEEEKTFRLEHSDLFYSPVS